MALIDTSILVYAARSGHREHEIAAKFLKSRSEGSELWHLTWQNIFEFIRTLTDPQIPDGKPFYIDEALDRARLLLSSPSLQIIHPGPRHFDIFADLASRTAQVRSIFVHDTRIAAIMIENGVKQIYTADDGFGRFRDIQVMNPFA